MDQIILKSVGSYIQGAEIGALLANGMPDLMEEPVQLDDASVEWLAELNADDAEYIKFVIADYDIPMSKEQLTALN